MLSKRPLMCVSLSFVAGMYILSIFNFVNVLTAFFYATITLVGLLLKKKNKQRIALVLLCLFAFFAGCLRYDSVNNINKKRLYEMLGKDITIEGVVLTTPKISNDYISFDLNVKNAFCENENKIIEEKVRVYCSFDENNKKVNIPQAKDVIIIQDSIKLPNENMNSGGFSYADYLKAEDIFFQCNTQFKNLSVKGHISSSVYELWASFRNKCIGFFDERFPENERAILKAFVLGEKSDITDKVSDTFSASGLSHILAVSGLHVSVFLSLLVSFLKFFRLSKRKEMMISVVGAAFFVLFTGASISALRAGIMCIFALLAKLVYRKADPITTLSMAAAVFCVFNPNVIYSISFMLSFAATAGILLFYENISSALKVIYSRLTTGTIAYKAVRSVCDSFAVGVSAQVFIVPIMVYVFNSVSTVSVLATMAITPMLSFLLAGGLIFIALSFINYTIAIPVAGFVYILAKIMLKIAEFFGNIPFAKLTYGQLTPLVILLYALLICVIVFAVKKNKKGYILSIISVTVISLVGLFNFYVNYDVARVTFLNVGQGDCAFLKAPGDCDVLIDAGGYDENRSVGEQVIAPYLIKSGITDIEYIIISHTHADHIVGLYGLLDRMKVENLILPYGQGNTQRDKEILEKAEECGVNILYFTAGDEIKINNEISIKIISPDGIQGKYAKDDNDKGIVLRIDYGENSFLFTGDLTSNVEKYLVEAYPEKLEADVLKVAHHGSKYSTSEEFLQAVNPEYAFVSVGINSYGHPTKEALQRLENANVEVFRADVHKDVSFYLDKEKIKKLVYEKTSKEVLP